MLYNQLKIARRQVQELKSNAVEIVEAEIIEEDFHLKSEVNALKIKLAEKNGSDGMEVAWWSIIDNFVLGLLLDCEHHLNKGVD